MCFFRIFAKVSIRNNGNLRNLTCFNLVLMNELVKNSHSRSHSYGIEHDLLFPLRILAGKELQELFQKNHYLIHVSLPFLHHLHELVKGSGFVIILTDGKGCILEIMGDSETIRDARALNMIPGAYMAEDSVGTNAMGLAIAENRPIQLTAQEHFINAYHRWTCSSAPVHDAQGRIIGVLNLTGRSKLVHPHTLGLVVTTVKAIEQQFHNDKLNHELQETSSYLDAVINNLSFAIMTVNTQGYINRINDTTGKIFDIRTQELYNQPISNYLAQWDEIWEVVKNGGRVLDEEIMVSNVSKNGNYVMNAMPILMNDSEVHGVILTFRDMKRVLNMVNKYTGMQAHFMFEDIIGASGAMKDIISFARKVSDSPSTVLITGESGTGKEVFAQAIHNASARRDAGFVAVNCGAIPETLFESELFGYDDGAFTGARKGGKPGKFELANGGTLFLDEVGEMPLDMQVKLLRAIQEGAINRVGGNKTIPVDVRIIAATNKDLKMLVEEKKFRLDLYYRLSVIPLKIPPLRERQQDIPVLVNFFLNTKALKLHKPVPELTDDIQQLLLRYEWPGNVRELENFIEKTVNLDGRIVLDVDDEDAFRKRYLLKTPFSTHTVPGKTAPSLSNEAPKSLEELEKDSIIATLEFCKGNKTQAAKVLQISRNTLYLKCKHYGISL